MTQINQLTDKEILEILMTSDFNEELKFEEMREYIFKFRSLYRVLHGNFSRFQGEMQLKTSNLENEVGGLKSQVNKLSYEKAQLTDKVDLMRLPRKLSLKERLTGKSKYIK